MKLCGLLRMSNEDCARWDDGALLRIIAKQFVDSNLILQYCFFTVHIYLLNYLLTYRARF